MVARACGCLCEFQHYAVDKYRAQRLAKFQKTRCAECVTKLNEEQARAAAAMPKKGEAFALLPAGTQMSMTRKPDGTWTGTLTAEGATIETVADGAQGLAAALARLWVASHGPRKEPEETPTATPSAKPAMAPAAKPGPSAATKIPPPAAASAPKKPRP